MGDEKLGQVGFFFMPYNVWNFLKLVGIEDIEIEVFSVSSKDYLLAIQNKLSCIDGKIWQEYRLDFGRFLAWDIEKFSFSVKTTS